MLRFACFYKLQVCLIAFSALSFIFSYGFKRSKICFKRTNGENAQK